MKVNITEIEVDFTVYLTSETDSCSTDRGLQEWESYTGDSIEWDEDLFTDEDNDRIQAYVDSNRDYLYDKAIARI